MGRVMDRAPSAELQVLVDPEEEARGLQRAWEEKQRERQEAAVRYTQAYGVVYGLEEEQDPVRRLSALDQLDGLHRAKLRAEIEELRARRAYQEGLAAARESVEAACREPKRRLAQELLEALEHLAALGDRLVTLEEEEARRCGRPDPTSFGTTLVPAYARSSVFGGEAAVERYRMTLRREGML